jgi:hypothetical protein
MALLSLINRPDKMEASSLDNNSRSRARLTAKSASSSEPVAMEKKCKRSFRWIRPHPSEILRPIESTARTNWSPNRARSKAGQEGTRRATREFICSVSWTIQRKPGMARDEFIIVLERLRQKIFMRRMQRVGNPERGISEWRRPRAAVLHNGGIPEWRHPRTAVLQNSRTPRTSAFGTGYFL